MPTYSYFAARSGCRGEQASLSSSPDTGKRVVTIPVCVFGHAAGTQWQSGDNFGLIN